MEYDSHQKSDAEKGAGYSTEGALGYGERGTVQGGLNKFYYAVNVQAGRFEVARNFNSGN